MSQSGIVVKENMNGYVPILPVREGGGDFKEDGRMKGNRRS